MADLEKRRARQRAYWARHREEKAAARARKALPGERVEVLRKRDRSDYARRSAAILAVKHDRRQAFTDAVRAQARASHRKRTPTMVVFDLLRGQAG